MGRYRKKPVVIEAEQFLPEMGQFPFPDRRVMLYDPGIQRWAIEPLEGQLTVSPGDWVIRGMKGEFYSCKPDIFEMTYEKE